MTAMQAMKKDAKHLDDDKAFDIICSLSSMVADLERVFNESFAHIPRTLPTCSGKASNDLTQAKIRTNALMASIEAGNHTSTKQWYEEWQLSIAILLVDLKLNENNDKNETYCGMVGQPLPEPPSEADAAATVQALKFFNVSWQKLKTAMVWCDKDELLEIFCGLSRPGMVVNKFVLGRAKP